MDEVLIIRPYAAADLARLRSGSEPAMARLLSAPALVPALAAARAQGFAWSGEVDGSVVGIAALAEKWPGSGIAWAVFTAATPKRAWVRIVGLARAELDRAHARGMTRIEASSRADFAPGHRLLALLGFRLETPAPAQGYGPDGAAHYLWARIAPIVSRATRVAA